ncbi:hypothetical protein DPMN_017361 [Dreissena polymorpha]|uniref:Uncharacterized protein n=1 Tax=Dreissena polymorpha TaxID=45954 RepID=A0A9D4S7D2_DREPO|nr:hypothetical protein DPMN_017361 [Dreissena polymorpha]
MCCGKIIHYTIHHVHKAKAKAGEIMMAGTQLKEEDEATYLGVTFDKRQIWKSHISHIEGTARRKLASMHNLLEQHGVLMSNIETIYQGTVRPTMYIAQQHGPVQPRRTSKAPHKYRTKHCES